MTRGADKRSSGGSLRRGVIERIRAEDADGAVRLARDAVRQRPQTSEGWFYLSTALGAAKDFSGAVRVAAHAAKIGVWFRRPAPGEGALRVLVAVSLENEWVRLTRAGDPVFVNSNDMYRALLGDAEIVQVVMSERITARWVKKNLGEFDLLLNAVSAPERTPRDLEHVETLTSGLGIPVINHPDRVRRSSRLGNTHRLGGHDSVVCPRTIGINLPAPGNRAAEAVRNAIDEQDFEYPVLIRWPGFQSGRHLYRCDKPNDVDALQWPEGLRQVLVSEYIDYAGGDGVYRKARAFIIGDGLYPRHLLMNDDWMVHAAGRRGTAPLRRDAALRDESLAFTDDMDNWLPHGAHAGLEGIRDTLGLDFCGIDFSVLPDGRLLLFEANPIMNIYMDPSSLPDQWARDLVDRIEPAVERITHAIRHLTAHKA